MSMHESDNILLEQVKNSDSSPALRIRKLINLNNRIYSINWDFRFH